MLKYKTGDTVKVMSGKDKGREGTILKLFPKKSKAVVEGINIYKKHIKANAARDNKGGVYEIPRAIDLSKLAIIDPKTKKPARIGFKQEGDKKVRINLKTGKNIDSISKA